MLASKGFVITLQVLSPNPLDGWTLSWKPAFLMHDHSGSETFHVHVCEFGRDFNFGPAYFTTRTEAEAVVADFAARVKTYGRKYSGVETVAVERESAFHSGIDTYRRAA